MKQIKNEQGFAMVLALLTLVLVTVIGTALIVVSSNVAKTAASERDDQAAFYSAEAEINKEIVKLNIVVNKIHQDAHKAGLENMKKCNDEKCIPLSYYESGYFNKFRESTKKHINDFEKNLTSNVKLINKQAIFDLVDTLSSNQEISEKISEKKIPFIFESIGQIDGQKRTIQQVAFTNTKQMYEEDAKNIEVPTTVIPNFEEYNKYTVIGNELNIPHSNGDEHLQGQVAIASPKNLLFNNKILNISKNPNGDFLQKKHGDIFNVNIFTHNNKIPFPKKTLVNVDYMSPIDESLLSVKPTHQANNMAQFKSFILDENKTNNEKTIININFKFTENYTIPTDFKGAIFMSENVLSNAYNYIAFKGQTLYTDAKSIKFSGNNKRLGTVHLVAPLATLKITGKGNQDYSFSGSFIVNTWASGGGGNSVYKFSTGRNLSGLLPPVDEQPKEDMIIKQFIQTEPLKEQ